MTTENKQFDVVAMGEILIDFTESGLSEHGQRLFEQNPGGAPANMASAVAKYGGRTAFIGKAGNDMHGHFLKNTLEDAGIDTSGVILADDVFTTLAFVALNNGEREFSFARKPGADTCLRVDELQLDVLDGAKVFHIGSLSLTDEPTKSATIFALAHTREKGAVISYDPNYRASLWQSRETAAQAMRSVLPFVDIMKLSDEETELLTGIADPSAAAKALCAGGITCVAVTLGKQGALVCIDGACRTVAGYDIPAIDTTGAGDAFWGGFVYKWLRSGLALRDITLDDACDYALFGNATATLCVTRRGGIPAMPTLLETEQLMASRNSG